jgi:hypothetical protein
MEVLWNSNEKCILGIVRDVVGRVEKRGRKEITSQMCERKKRKNDDDEVVNDY